MHRLCLFCCVHRRFLFVCKAITSESLCKWPFVLGSCYWGQVRLCTLSKLCSTRVTTISRAAAPKLTPNHLYRQTLQHPIITMDQHYPGKVIIHFALLVVMATGVSHAWFLSRESLCRKLVCKFRILRELCSWIVFMAVGWYCLAWKMIIVWKKFIFYRYWYFKKH